MVNMDGKIDYNNFIPKYLATFGVYGGWDEYLEILYWHQNFSINKDFTMFPFCLNEIYKEKGLATVFIKMDQILDKTNWDNALVEYKKQNEKK